MSENLVTLLQNANEIAEKIIEAEGELTPDLEIELDLSDVAVSKKIDSISFILDRLQSDTEHFKSQAQQYANAARSLENAQKYLKERMKTAMIQYNVTRIDGVDVYFRISKAKARLVVDEDKLPSNMLMEVIVYKPDNERIRETIIANNEVPGAHLEETYSLRKYPNTKKGK